MIKKGLGGEGKEQEGVASIRKRVKRRKKGLKRKENRLKGEGKGYKRYEKGLGGEKSTYIIQSILNW